jgi:hypothetical protein
MNGHGIEQKKGHTNGKHNLITTVTFLNREQIDFLDKLDKDYHFKFGHSLPRGRILGELVNCLMELDIDLTEIDPDKEGLCSYILKKAKDHAEKLKL